MLSALECGYRLQKIKHKAPPSMRNHGNARGYSYQAASSAESDVLDLYVGMRAFSTTVELVFI